MEQVKRAISRFKRKWPIVAHFSIMGFLLLIAVGLAAYFQIFSRQHYIKQMEAEFLSVTQQIQRANIDS